MDKIDQFGIYFGMLKIRYQDLSSKLASHNIEIPSNKVNVFINLETALNYLSTIKDLEKRLMIDRRYPEDMKVDIINLAGYYKDFFAGNELDTKVFIYMTDLTSDEEGGFYESSLVEDYRSYYLLKYTENPRYVTLGDRLKDEIIPDVRLLCEYIPNVYFISIKNVDSGVIPYVIGQSMPDRTNVIISSDIQDTQYNYKENYLSIYFKRSIKRGPVMCLGTKEYLDEITRTDIQSSIVETYKNEMFYKTFLACIGDKYRSISSIQGLNVSTIEKKIRDGINEHKITWDLNNPMMVSSIFDENLQGTMYSNLLAVDVENSYQNLLDGKKKSILSQITDRYDVNALQELNRTRFSKNKLYLEILLK